MEENIRSCRIGDCSNAVLTQVAGASYGAYKLVKEHAKEKAQKLALGVLGSALTSVVGLALIKKNHEYCLQRPIIRQEFI